MNRDTEIAELRAEIAALSARVTVVESGVEWVRDTLGTIIPKIGTSLSEIIATMATGHESLRGAIAGLKALVTPLGVAFDKAQEQQRVIGVEQTIAAASEAFSYASVAP